MDGAPQVLVQGIADVDARDLEANRGRYTREARREAARRRRTCCRRSRSSGCSASTSTASTCTCGRSASTSGPAAIATREPQLFDAHMEEVRSGHDEEPAAPHAGARAARRSGTSGWTSSAGGYPKAVLSLVAPDGFPFSVRVPISVDPAARRVRIGGDVLGRARPAGARVRDGPRSRSRLPWQRNFQVRGDLVEEDGGWVLVPQRMVGGLELPPVSKLQLYADERRQDGPLLAHRKKNETRDSALEERASGDRGLRGGAASLTSSWLRSLRLGPRLCAE